MARNQDGEFELLVGNTQLLTVVVITIMLFGIVFGLGYIVGRNSAPEATAANAAASKTPVADSAGARPAATGPPAQASDSPLASDLPNENLAPGEAEVAGQGTRPVATTSPETPIPAVTPRLWAKAAAETHPPLKPAATPKQVVQDSQPSVPEPGQVFLQVAAVKRPEAELVVDVLRKKGFRATVAPVELNGRPSDTLFRALVGPFKDASTLAKANTDLESAGFKPIVRKY